MMKVLSQAKRPSAALGLYAESGVFAELYPELGIGLPTAGVKADRPSEVSRGGEARRLEDLAQTLRACDAFPAFDRGCAFRSLSRSLQRLTTRM